MAVTAIAAMLLVGNVISRHGFDLVFAISFCFACMPMLQKLGLRNWGSLGVVAGLLVAVFVSSEVSSDVQFAPYLAVALINGFVAYVFFHNQLPGRTPLIIQLIGLLNIAPVRSDEFKNFINRQCWAWVALGGTTSIFGLVAMFQSDMRPATAPIISGLITTQFIWFFASHAYANWRHKRPETWRDTFRAMSRPTIWQELNL